MGGGERSQVGGEQSGVETPGGEDTGYRKKLCRFIMNISKDQLYEDM